MFIMISIMKEAIRMVIIKVDLDAMRKMKP